MVLFAQNAIVLVLKVDLENSIVDIELGLTVDRQLVRSAVVSSWSTLILYSRWKAFVSSFKRLFMLSQYIYVFALNTKRERERDTYCDLKTLLNALIYHPGRTLLTLAKINTSPELQLANQVLILLCESFDLVQGFSSLYRRDSCHL